ncbi:MAG: anti-sigma factor family protein [Acidobacteriota bacterium]
MRVIEPLEPKACEQVRRLLDDFLNDELSVETNQEILLHLEHCGNCQQERAWRQFSRGILDSGWNSQVVPRSLRARIEKSVTPRRLIPPSWLRLAAGFLLLVLSLAAVKLWLSSPPSTSTFVDRDHPAQLIASHFDCARDGWASAAKLPVSVSSLKAVLRHGEQRLTTAHLCSFRSLNLIHYVFEADGRKVSLMLERRPGNRRLPENGQQALLVVRKIPFHLYREPAASLLSAEGVQYFVHLVDEAPESAVALEFLRAVLPPLNPLFGQSMARRVDVAARRWSVPLAVFACASLPSVPLISTRSFAEDAVAFDLD